MKLLRDDKAKIDFKFQSKFFDISSKYKEVDEEDPRLLCQASWETVRYINENLPDDLEWDNGNGILIDTSNNEYEDSIKAEFNGVIYAICPEAYDKLDELLPTAIEHGLKVIFGHARKRK